MARVGLLEDNARIAKLCATMLQYAGHHVTIFEHPEDCLNALSLLPTNENDVRTCPFPASLPIDVLMLDLHLPDIDGIDVLHFLSSHPLTNALPLIFCTAATSSEIAAALNVAPHAGFVEKPFTFLELTSAITTALSPH